MSMPPPSQFNTHANLFASESCLIKHGGNGAKQNTLQKPTGLTSSTTRLPCTGITARTNRTNKPARAARSGRPRFSHDLQYPTHSLTHLLAHSPTHSRQSRASLPEPRPNLLSDFDPLHNFAWALASRSWQNGPPMLVAFCKHLAHQRQWTAGRYLIAGYLPS
jgi:hypothetical protein